MISSVILRSARRSNKVFSPLSYGIECRIKQLRVSFLTTPAHSSREKSEHTNQWPFLKQGKARNLASNANLTEEQKQHVVDQINKRSLDELKKTKHIGKLRASSILQFREEFGPLPDFETLLSIKGIGKSFLHVLEELSGQLPEPENKQKSVDVLTQLLTKEEKENISNLVSIDIGFRNCAWVQLDRDKKVLGWSRTELPIPKPYNPRLFRDAVRQFINTLPPTDLFVIELQSHRIGRNDSVVLPFVIHLRVMEAMLHCLLSGKVVSFDPRHTSRHFSLKAGAKKKRAATSLVGSLFQEMKGESSLEGEYEMYLQDKMGLSGSEDIIKKLAESTEADSEDQTEAVSKDQRKGPPLKISPDLVDYFNSCTKKDDLSDCLLQAITFYDLVINSR